MANFQAKVAEMETKRDTQLAELAASEAALEASIAELSARTGAPPPAPTGITPAEAEKALEGMRRQLEREARKASKTPEEVLRMKDDHSTLKEVLKMEGEALAAVRDNRERLAAENLAMMRRFKATRAHLGGRVDGMFRQLMKKKGYGSRLVFEHGVSSTGRVQADDGQLTIFVTPDRMTRFEGLATQVGLTEGADAELESKALQEVNTLGGGEKSTSTLILLTAIARQAPVPFRMMDEFDVFQDEAARRMSIRMLLEAASEVNPDGRFPQFILLTPHDVSSVMNVRDRENIRVLHLDDPERSGGGGGGAAGAM